MFRFARPLALFLALTTLPSLLSQSVAAAPHPAFAPIEDQEGLPRVLLIGDSISIGYTLPVRDKLAGAANVHRIPENGEATIEGLEKLDAWLGDKPWDVIHFNWGLHDVKHIDAEGNRVATDVGNRKTTIDTYEANLRQLVQRLKQTGAKLIWASTTPVPQGAHSRIPGDAARYNAIAEGIMCSEGIVVNDLHSFAKARLRKIQQPRDVHFAATGSTELAEQVVTHIDAALESKATPAARPAEAPPNIVFLLVDDWGHTGGGVFGSDYYETPNIDALAASGMRFTNAYAACTVCSPTRASVMTGKYPARLRVTDWIAGHDRPQAKLRIPEWTKYLPHKEVTIAEALRTAGYATGSVGKWHLTRPETDREHEGMPTRHGFDINVGGTRWGMPRSYFHPYGGGPGGKSPLLAHLPPCGKKSDYLTDVLTNEAIRFIDAKKNEPFFLYLPYFNVHRPLEGKLEYVARFKEKEKPELRHRGAVYAAMLQSVDESIGRIVSRLDELGLAEDTVIFLTGDNGGLTLSETTDNAPLRDGKGSAYEGGVRVPGVVRWPGVTQPGSVSDEPIITPDFYPTILEITGTTGDTKHNQEVDGTSLVPVFRDAEAQLDRDAIYWHYPHYHPGGAKPYGAIRRGDYRLVEFYEDMRAELYDLKNDPGEKNNLLESQPARAKELRERLQAWRTTIGAQMPTDNPNYQPRK